MGLPLILPGPSGLPPLPPAARSVEVVFYQDQYGRTPTRAAQPWRTFVELLTRFVEVSPCTVAAGPKKCKGKDCSHKAFSVHPGNPMAWAPTVIEGNRLDENVRALTLLALDYDHLSAAQWLYVQQKLAAYEYVWHTTHSHRDGDGCYRVVILLSQPVHANVWHRFLPAAIDFLDLTLVYNDSRGKPVRQPDRTCKNRSRFYYRPSHPADAPHSGGHNEGRVLEVADVLAHAATHLPEAEVDDLERRPLPDPEDWDLDSQHVLDAIDCISRYLPPTGRHPLALAIGGMLRRAGASLEVARYILSEGFKQGGSSDPAARAKTVEHTYSLGEEAAMTGFTRAAEIMGEAEAVELRHYLTLASNEVFLRNVPVRERAARRPSAAADSAAASNVYANGHASFSLPPLPAPLPAGIEHRVVVELTRAHAQRRAQSTERNHCITATLLRRVLAGEPLAQSNGEGDVATRREGKEHGLVPKQAISCVASELGRFVLPPEAPWSAAELLLAPSLNATVPEPGENWFKTAKISFEAGRSTRQRDLREEQERRSSYAEGVRRAALLASGGGGGGGSSEPPDPNWQDNLTKNGAGAIAQSFHNARVILRNHSDFCGHLRFNEVSKRVEVTGGPLLQYRDAGLDALVAGIQDHLSSAHALSLANHKDLGRRVLAVARAHSYDPIKEYLNGLVWDGVDRATDWLIDYCGARVTDENRRFLREVGRKWLIALVARGLEPGCKVDNVLVLEGDGGMGKSSVFEIIAREFFCDTAISVGDKDSRMLAARYWICELPEIVAFKRSTHEQLKSFFSARSDKFRLPYGSEIEEFMRRCLWVGTTNDEAYLGDPTGNRKYWTVACVYTAEALAALRRDRDQLLAQAVAAYRAGERWWFTYEEIGITEGEADKRVIESPALLRIQKWWFAMTPGQRRAHFSSMTTLDVYDKAFEGNSAQLKSNDLQAIGHAMRKLGFIRKRDSMGSSRQWRYYPTHELFEASQAVKHLVVHPGGRDKDDTDKSKSAPDVIAKKFLDDE